jgi:hypothetical protein
VRAWCEDRKLLLGHKASHVTTHYSAPEIEMLIHASEKVCDLGSRKSVAPLEHFGELSFMASMWRQGWRQR